jgi:hypothetical protein
MHARAGEQASRVGERASGGLSEEAAGGGRGFGAALSAGEGGVGEWRRRRTKVDRGRCEIWVGEDRSDAGGMRFVFLVSDDGRWMDETWTCPMCFSGISMIRKELLPMF